MEPESTPSGELEIIDAHRWLADRIDELIEERRFSEAIRYLRRLVLKVGEPECERQCATYLGYLYLLTDDREASQKWLERAESQVPSDPHLRYALGHLAASRGRHAQAALYFLEAFVEADKSYDEAEFLRSGALAMMGHHGPAPPVAGMLLGALDRDIGNPWILDALARVYEADQRWMESLETLSMLADIVDDATDSVVVHRAPTARQLLRNQLMGRPARPDELEQRSRAINEAVREQFEIVLDERHRRGPTELAPLRFPPAMNRLVQFLDWRDRGVELIETAQKIWAQARGEAFDEMLGGERLAAAIHVLVERLHWREPTPRSELARLHGASPGAIPAAARVVAGRLGLELFDYGALKSTLAFDEVRRLDDVHRALLYGEGLGDTRSGAVRLGG